MPPPVCTLWRRPQARSCQSSPFLSLCPAPLEFRARRYRRQPRPTRRTPRSPHPRPDSRAASSPISVDLPVPDIPIRRMPFMNGLCGTSSGRAMNTGPRGSNHVRSKLERCPTSTKRRAHAIRCLPYLIRGRIRAGVHSPSRPAVASVLVAAARLPASGALDGCEAGVVRPNGGVCEYVSSATAD